VDALRAAGRGDLAGAAARLSPADRARISVDASVYLDRSRDKDLAKAISRAAIGLPEVRPGSSSTAGTTPD
jgi:hypothetical protein